jgi:hypothetical protein
MLPKTALGGAVTVTSYVTGHCWIIGIWTVRF